MKRKKFLLPLLSTVLSVAFLFGCEGVDDPDHFDTDNPDVNIEDNQMEENKTNEIPE